MQGEAADYHMLLRMTGQIKVSGDRFSCVFVVFPYVLYVAEVFSESVARCKTCPFICNVEKLSAPKRSIKITDHFTCTSTNVIYCITCTLCKKLYIGETGRRLGDRFRENLRHVEKDDKNPSKPLSISLNR